MSELLRQLSKYLRPKEQDPKEEEMYARVAYMIFFRMNGVGPQNQSVTDRFHERFDLSKHPVGTVFRLRMENQTGQSVHSFFAIAKAGKKPDDIRVFHPKIPDPHTVSLRPYMLLPHQFDVGRVPVASIEFPIEQSVQALWGPPFDHKANLDRLPDHIRTLIFDPVEIAIIQGGHKKRIDEPERAPIGEPVWDFAV